VRICKYIFLFIVKSYFLGKFFFKYVENLIILEGKKRVIINEDDAM
jgi:hypothetical protein